MNAAVAAPAMTADSDRFARARLVEGWDTERLAAATAVVAGVGALGNELAKNLALAGVGRLVLCDPDTVAVTNLSRTVLFTEADIGSLKSLAAAAALGPIAPGTAVDARTTDLVSGVGLGELADVGVVLGCLDSIRSRMQLLGRATLIGAALVDGGTGGWAGDVRVRLDPDEPCFACGLTAHQRGLSDVPWSCADPPPAGPAASSIVATALIASWMTVAALRILLGDPPPWRLLRTDALRGHTEPVDQVRDPGCPHHEPLVEPILPVAVGYRGTVGELLAALPDGAEPRTWASFRLPQRCAVCRHEQPEGDGSCERCGAPLRPRLTGRIRDAGPDRRLCDIGIAPQEILPVRMPEGGHQWRRLT